MCITVLEYKCVTYVVHGLRSKHGHRIDCFVTQVFVRWRLGLIFRFFRSEFFAHSLLSVLHMIFAVK